MSNNIYKSIFDRSKLRDVILQLDLPSQWNVVYKEIESFLYNPFNIDFANEMAIPDQHYLEKDLDEGTIAKATESEKLLALCLAGEYLRKFGEIKSYNPVDTGTLRKSLETYIGLSYLDSKIICDQSVRNFMVAKLASNFILRMQNYSPDAHIVFSHVIIQYSLIIAPDAFNEIVYLIHTKQSA